MRRSIFFFQGPGRLSKILLMEEIRKKPGEVGSLSHYFVGFWNTWMPQEVSKWLVNGL